MIKAVIFDCFGVLTTDGWLPFKEKYFGNNPELYVQAVALNKLVDAGKMPYRDFIHDVAKLAEVSDEIALAEIERNAPNNELFTYIKNTLKHTYGIGMLSNVAENWLDKMFSKDQVELFDAVALSGETGFIKPQRESYEIIAGRLDVTPDECVLIDDQPTYCDGARDIGMQAIHYTSFDQLKNDLASVLKLTRQ